MLKSSETSKHRVASSVNGNETVHRHMSEIHSINSENKRKHIYETAEKINTVNISNTIDDVSPTFGFQDICSTAFRLNNGILKTPCEKSCLSDSLGCELYFKKEFLQASGSYKDRSTYNILMQLNDQQRSAGVITASSGNIGLSMAYQGQQMGIPITIVMPMFTHLMKIQTCKNYGADVIVWGRTLKNAIEYAIKLSEEKKCYYLDSFDHPLAITSAGTIGLEIVEQIPDVDAVIVPVGSGVLIAGISLAVKKVKPSVRIIGVESEACPNFSLSLEEGRPITVCPESSIAEELSLSQVDRNAFRLCAPLVEKVIIAKEDNISLAVLRLLEEEKIIIEGSGACGLAALLQGDLGDFQGGKVVVCLTEANINTTSYSRCLERGMAVDGRLLKVAVTVADHSGAITELVELISKLGILINNLWQHQEWIKDDIYSSKVELICETIDKNHSLMLEKELRNRYSQMSVLSNFELEA